MGWMDLFTGGATSTIKAVSKTANGVMDRFWPKKMAEKEKAEMFLERIDRDIKDKDIKDVRTEYKLLTQTIGKTDDNYGTGYDLLYC